MKRNAQSDLIRVLSCILVIAVHVRGEVVEAYPLFDVWVKPALIVCNPLFFMLSGKYGLRPVLDEKNGYIRYYSKKFANILVPYILFCLLIYLCSNNGASFNVIEFVKLFLTNGISYHLWFMGPMIGLLISAPFFSIIANNLSIDGRKTMLFIGLLWNAALVIFANFFRTSWAISLWLLSSWTFYFFLGFFTDDIKNDHVTTFLILGLICYCLTCFQKLCLPQESLQYVEDCSPLFTGFALAIYLLLDRVLIVRNNYIAKLLSFVGQRSFYIYLVHILVDKWLCDTGLFACSNIIISYIFRIIMTFIISLLCAHFFYSMYNKVLRSIPILKVL